MANIYQMNNRSLYIKETINTKYQTLNLMIQTIHTLLLEKEMKTHQTVNNGLPH